MIDPIADPVGAAAELLGMPPPPPPPGRLHCRYRPPVTPRSRARTLAELFAEPIFPVASQAFSDCGVCAVCAAGGIAYDEFLRIDPRTPAEIARRATRGRGLYAREMVAVLEAVWPGSRWYVQAGFRDLATWHPTAPAARGIILTPGHWVAFQYNGGAVMIADNSLVPAANYGGTMSKIVAPSPRTDPAQCRRAAIPK